MWSLLPVPLGCPGISKWEREVSDPVGIKSTFPGDLFLAELLLTKAFPGVLGSSAVVRGTPIQSRGEMSIPMLPSVARFGFWILETLKFDYFLLLERRHRTPFCFVVSLLLGS